jgi:hypothetical protein
MALAGVSLALALAGRVDAPVAAQGSPVDVVILHDPAPRSGDYAAMYLAADVPSTGEITVLLDGLGVLWNGFVLRAVEQPPGSCFPPEPSRCTPCPAGRRCFTRDIEIHPATPPGHYQLPLTVTDATGRTTRMQVPIDVRPPRDDDRDGVPDAWEFRYKFQTAGPEYGADGDPDGDGVSNLEEFHRDTNPVARYVQYFAEGSSGQRAPAHVHGIEIADLRYDGDTGWVRFIGDGGRRALSVGGTGALGIEPDRIVAMIVETQGPAAAARGVTYTDGRMAPAAPFRSVSMQPSPRWYFADGGTDGTLDTFFLTYNPTAAPVEATITYRLPDGTTARRSRRTIEPESRTTIWTNVDDAALGRVEASVEIEATAPILVERAWRFDPPGRTVTQALANPGSDRPATRWVFPDVDATARFDTTIVIANAAPQAAIVDVSLLYGDRAPASMGQLRIPPRGRVSLPARQLSGLVGTRASVEITSRNGALIVADRTFSGRDAEGAWRLATAGARGPAARWVFPRSMAGSSTELVVTNLSPFDAHVLVYFAKNDSYIFDSPVEKLITVPARRRVVYPVGSGDPAYPYTPGITRVSSQATPRGIADIVVEAISYGEGEFGPRTRASGILGTPVP